MNIFDKITLAGLFPVLAWGVYALVRNEWVYRERLRMIDRDLEQYLRLPSYEVMMWRRWWVWRVEDFL